MEAEKVAFPTTEAGLEPLHFLKSTDPPLWLTPNPSLSKVAHLASQHLFSTLKSISPKSPFDRLLVDGFDAEQIWQQIDLQSQPLLARVHRDLKRFEKNPKVISNLNVALDDKKNVIQEMVKGLGEESDDFEEDIKEFDEDEDEGEDEDKDVEEGEENYEEKEEEEEEEEDGDTEMEESDDEDEGEEGNDGIEDGFLKIKELEKFMEEDEVREYGLEKNKSSKKEKKQSREREEESDDDEDQEDDELGEFDLHDEEDEDGSKLGKARYEDFFGAKQKNSGRKKSKLMDGSESEVSVSGDEESDDGAHDEQKSEKLSTHQKELKKLQSQIEMMEKANLEPKTWTMQGEVTAARRPKNSALEVDLDFEHNVRPTPVITEEVTATLEEMIQKRILEGRFDDVRKAPKRPTKAPREIKDLDENKSKKGLGELYEEEYVEKTNLATAPSSSFLDETKKEASMLFKELCLKLDALSHFTFAPKPVIEDMSIAVNVPALAMEEIAPVAVSDAAMLAPEEVFAGKGEIKEDVELTQSDRKRRRANKKRKYKAMVAKRDAKKPKNTTVSNPNEGQ